MNEYLDLIYYLIGVNFIGFLLMGIDKRKAKKQQYRIPERTFWILALLGGAVGSFIGMQIFRHKTKHKSFVIGMPFVFLCQFAICFYLFILS
ncbi:DUF1294 domain-containing protein [Virgibacillus sp. W0181]|uniref:DUF1294 domain-containing protein n=1 Tax=Virgibacillus sp. W0181 TaxID=3391581 RepID=UPI003F4494EE